MDSFSYEKPAMVRSLPDLGRPGFAALFEVLYAQRLYVARWLWGASVVLSLAILFAGDLATHLYPALALKAALVCFAGSVGTGVFSVLGTSLRSRVKREDLLRAAIHYKIETMELLEPGAGTGRARAAAEGAFLTLRGGCCFLAQCLFFGAGFAALVAGYLIH